MKALFYRILTVLARTLGLGPVRLLARGVAAGYFFLFPARVAVGVRFYRALFPHRGALFALGCTWRQFQEFTHVFVDRLRLQGFGPLSYRFDGLERLAAAQAAGRGAVLLMSHLGNWEVAAHLLKRHLPGLSLMLYMGARPGEQIEGLQKTALRAGGVRVVGVGPRGGSPLDIVDAVRFLRAGGFVSMAGDLVWHPAQSTLAVNFLGRRVALPRAPFHLASATGAPLFIFFALREAPGRFVFWADEALEPAAETPGGRKDNPDLAAQAYADRLADTVRCYPFQWHHFTALTAPRPDKEGPASPGRSR